MNKRFIEYNLLLADISEASTRGKDLLRASSSEEVKHERCEQVDTV